MIFDPDHDDWLQNAFQIIDRTPNVEETIAELRDTLEVDHIVYHSSKLGNNPSVEPYIQLTYPASWVKRYLMMGYVDVDPVLREGFLRTLPFDWSELTISTQAEGAMLMDALSHGVGPHGLSVPVRSKQGHRGLFSMSYSGAAEDWTRFRNTRMRGLGELAHRLHARVVKERFGESHTQLAARELDCLFWTARGKDAKDTAVILGISHHTARDYLKSARYKLDCVTSAQAVNKAVQLGLLVVEAR